MPRLPKRRSGTDFTPLQSRIMSDRLRALSEQVVAVSLVSPLGLGCAAYAMLGVVPRERVILWLILAGVAVGTVKSQMRDALVRLRQELPDLDDLPLVEDPVG